MGISILDETENERLDGISLLGNSFSTDFNKVAAKLHTHAVSEVTGLQGALDGKANSSHNHDGLYLKKGESFLAITPFDFTGNSNSAGEWSSLGFSAHSNDNYLLKNIATKSIRPAIFGYAPLHLPHGSTIISLKFWFFR